MRRAVAVTGMVLGCDVCGETCIITIGDTGSVAAWHSSHAAPVLLRLLAEADCDCDA